MEKNNKTQGVGVRLNENQKEALQQLVGSGKAKTISAAIQYLINQYIILK